jgi:hypothetical protein
MTSLEVPCRIHRQRPVELRRLRHVRSPRFGNMGSRMQSPDDYRRCAEECERMARECAPEHRPILLQIARAWRECAEQAEAKKSNEPSSVDGD